MADTTVKWQDRFSEKLASAEKAVTCLRRGQRIFIGSGAAEPIALVKAMTARGREIVDAEIIHLMTLGAAPYADEAFSNVFRHNALFVGANVRSAVAEGRADYTPIFLSEVPKLFRSRRIHLDVAMIQVSPPDAHGYCSYGVSVDVVKAAAESADVVIAEVDQHMPRTLGDSFIHVDEIDYLVESPYPLLESLPGKSDEVAMKIGANVAGLIEDGSTLQMGIGSIPNAVLECLKDKKDLGVHTEMFSDGVIDLVKAGVITCEKKTLLPGKIVSSFCIGSRALYDFVDNNPFFEFRPTEFTNNPFTIARNDKMVAINAAIEVDLTGQVCADSIGQRFYSGIGGQVDFIRGAAHSQNGKPIIVLRSTAKNDTVSRIVPFIKEGGGVVTTRGDVHYVVTEYGIADLWGKNVRERAMALISVAHPEFRDELLAEAKKRRLIFDDQILLPRAEYPAQWETEKTFGDTVVHFRPIKPTDESLVKDAFYTLSAQSIFQRFFTMVNAAPHARLQEVVNVDYKDKMRIVGIVKDGDGERMAAAGVYVRNPASQMAEVAFLVHDDFQNRGIGTFLFQYIIKIARENGLKGLTADVLGDNRKMMQIFNKSGYRIESSMTEGVYHLQFLFDDLK